MAGSAISSHQANAQLKEFSRLQDIHKDSPDFKKWCYYKSHITQRWVYDLAQTSRILDLVETLIGPDILLWNSFIPAKAPMSCGKFDWHQDATYWYLSPPEDTVSVWLALSEVTPENGCMRVLPKSHKLGQIDHTMTFDETSLLRRGQKISSGIDEELALDVTLCPGEFSVHSPLIVHGSSSNNTEDWRVGVGLNYVPCHVIPRNPESALLVRGEDHFKHFLPEQPPHSTLDKTALSEFDRVMAILSERYSDH